MLYCYVSSSSSECALCGVTVRSGQELIRCASGGWPWGAGMQPVCDGSAPRFLHRGRVRPRPRPPRPRNSQCRRQPGSLAAHDAQTSGTTGHRATCGHQRGGNLASTRRPAVRKVRTKHPNSYLGVQAWRIHLLTLYRSFLSAGAGRQHECQHPTARVQLSDSKIRSSHRPNVRFHSQCNSSSA